MVLGENLSFLVKFNSDSGVAVFAKIGRKSYIPWKIELKKLKKILLKAVQDKKVVHNFE